MNFGKRHPTGQSFLERRSARRQQTQSTGEILVPGKPPHRCLVSQFSETGASLQLPSLFGIANTFELRAFGRIHRARGVRQRCTSFLLVLVVLSSGLTNNKPFRRRKTISTASLSVGPS